MNPRMLKMTGDELQFWDRVRRRGAMWYLVSKGFFFLLLYPTIGCTILEWSWQPELLVEGWFIGLVCGGLVWMRKELRFRFTLEDEGICLPDGPDE